MTRDDARALVCGALRAVAPEADVARLGPCDDLQGDLELDSIDFLAVVAEVENALGRRIPERDLPRLASLDGFVDYVAASAPAA
jgi:acyl carrier protein